MLGALEHRAGFRDIRSCRHSEGCESGIARELGHVLDALKRSFRAAFKLWPVEARGAAEAAERQDETVRNRRAQQTLRRPDAARSSNSGGVAVLMSSSCGEATVTGPVWFPAADTR